MDNMKEKAKVYLWTGDGWGKSTSSFGAALRCIGHGYNVIIIQFMKGRKNIGEFKISKRLGPKYEIHQFGRKGWVDLKNPSEQDKALAVKGLDFAKKCLKKKPFLLILDEINLAVAIKLLDEKEATILVADCEGIQAVYSDPTNAVGALVVIQITSWPEV